MKRWVKTIAALALAAGLLASPLGAASPYEPLNPGAAGAAGRRTPIVAAIEKARPAVVSIYAVVDDRRDNPFDPFQDDFFNRFFENPWQQRPRQNVTLGSGVIIDGRRGLIATNEHVIRGALRLTVTLGDGRELEGRVVGSDSRHDLALVTVQAGQPLPQLALGDSDGLMIGETVIAIGNPFGLSHSATTGVVSALGRSVPGDGRSAPLEGLIQTDASINPGNSGGPLLNINGEIVGLNAAIIAGGEGLGFAIPAKQIKSVAADILNHVAGGAGTRAADISLLWDYYGLKAREEGGRLVLAAPRRGSPAERLGLRQGDVLLALGRMEVATQDDLAEAAWAAREAQQVDIAVQRGRVIYRASLSRDTRRS